MNIGWVVMLTSGRGRVVAAVVKYDCEPKEREDGFLT